MYLKILWSCEIRPTNLSWVMLLQQKKAILTTVSQNLWPIARLACHRNGTDGTSLFWYFVLGDLRKRHYCICLVKAACYSVIYKIYSGQNQMYFLHVYCINISLKQAAPESRQLIYSTVATASSSTHYQVGLHHVV